MNTKLHRRISYALSYVADNTFIGADAKWHFKRNYNPQILLDAIDFLNDPTKPDLIKTDTAVCSKCTKPVEYDYIPDRGIMSSLDYDLIADSISSIQPIGINKWKKLRRFRY